MGMITFEEALRIIWDISVQPAPETVPLANTLHRVLAIPVVSDVDIPPFNKAAMDGYACRIADLSHELEVIEEIPAGKFPLKKIGPLQCSKIMTGAAIPEGADIILMKEYVEITGGSRVKSINTPTVANICYTGEDVKRGDVVLDSGTRLYPPHLAMLASTGCIKPEVFSLPSVAVISTGDELVEPEEFPGKAAIRNSNGYQLTAQLLQYGLTSDYLGIVKDNRAELLKKLSSSLEKYDIILVSGGVSVGDYDYIPEILKELGAEIFIHGLKVRPGKHFLLCRIGKHFIAGMPGNPVSSFVMFEVLIKPLLNKLMGIETDLPRLLIPIETEFSRKKTDVLGFIPVSLNNSGSVIPVDYHGSAHIGAYTKTYGIMEVPVGTAIIKQGDLVYVRPI